MRFLRVFSSIGIDNDLGGARCITRPPVNKGPNFLKEELSLEHYEEAIVQFLDASCFALPMRSRSAQPRDLRERNREKTTNASSNTIATPWLQRILSLFFLLKIYEFRERTAAISYSFSLSPSLSLSSSLSLSLFLSSSYYIILDYPNILKNVRWDGGLSLVS